MAQREDGAELSVPDTASLCVNNCGFHGNPSTNNMCPACFSSAERGAPPPSCSGHEKPRSALIKPQEGRRESEIKPERAGSGPAEPAVSRCAGCKRRVGLAGFRCRCGELFCAAHRHSERHACSYDYKAAGREAIARENPIVRATKIVRL